MPKYVLAIDQGTSSTRTILFNREGCTLGQCQMEHTQYYPKAGWVEHDPLEIWSNTCQLVEQILAKTGVTKDEIAAVGITNQRETTLIWEKSTGKPIHNALVWQDTRTDALIAELASSGGQDRFRGKVGLPLATYFSGPKIAWLLENVPGAREQAETGDLLFGTIDTWLIWNLTGGPNGGLHLTDVSNASRTMLMNLDLLTWDPDMLAELQIPALILPSILPSSAFFGECQTAGLKGVPIAGDLGDQQAALFGQNCFLPGEAKNTYGTGCFMLMNTGNYPVQSHHGLLTTLGYQIGQEAPVYCLEGSIAITGALVQWLRDNLHLIDHSADVEKLAATVEDSGGIYFVPAFSGLYAPYWKSDARGVIAGLTRFVNSGHIARAVLEATAYQTREVLDAMFQDSGVELKELKVDGGMTGNNLLMQFQADILGVPVVKPVVAETTALGAAYAAGLAVGYWQKKEDLIANWQMDKRWQPTISPEGRARLYAGWKKAVTRTFDWVD
jgi:glycerol kinase